MNNPKYLVRDLVAPCRPPLLPYWMCFAHQRRKKPFQMCVYMEMWRVQFLVIILLIPWIKHLLLSNKQRYMLLTRTLEIKKKVDTFRPNNSQLQTSVIQVILMQFAELAAEPLSMVKCVMKQFVRNTIMN